MSKDDQFWNSASVLNLERALATVGALTVTAIAVGGFMVYRGTRKSTLKLPKKFILELDLESNPLKEADSAVGLSGAIFGEGQRGATPIYGLVNGLERASRDDRVQGLLCYVGNNSVPSMAAAQDFREAISAFRANKGSDVKSIVHAYTFGLSGDAKDLITYYIASAFQRVYMQSTGQILTLGFGVVSPFFKNLLDKWKIQPMLFAREEYKSAASSLTQEKYSESDKEQLQKLLSSWSDQVVEGVGASRGMSVEKAKTLIDDSPHTGDESIVRGFIDGVKYRGEAQEEICGKPEETLDQSSSKQSKKEKDSKVIKRVSFTTYLKAMRQEDQKKGLKVSTKTGLFSFLMGGEEKSGDLDQEDKKLMIKCKLPVVALVTAVGPIVARSSRSPLNPGESSIAAAKLEKDLRRLRQDPVVKAVVLRVNSPGGMATASDTIYAEIKNLVQAGKPVVISMGGVAASGGYYISAPASKIVAQPGTVTGSIGVIFGKINVREAALEQGISLDEILEGKNASALSALTGLNEEQTQLINKIIDDIYNDFLAKVALGRNMSVDQVRKVAKGRVWTGQDAFDNGLVDELGGLQHCIETAKKLANLSTEVDKTMVVPYPPPSPFQQLLRSLSGAGVVAPTMGFQNLLQVVPIEQIEPTLRFLHTLQQGPALYSIHSDLLQGAFRDHLD